MASPAAITKPSDEEEDPEMEAEIERLLRKLGSSIVDPPPERQPRSTATSPTITGLSVGEASPLRSSLGGSSSLPYHTNIPVTAAAPSPPSKQAPPSYYNHQYDHASSRSSPSPPRRHPPTDWKPPPSSPESRRGKQMSGRQRQ